MNVINSNGQGRRLAVGEAVCGESFTSITITPEDWVQLASHSEQEREGAWEWLRNLVCSRIHTIDVQYLQRNANRDKDYDYTVYPSNLRRPVAHKPASTSAKPVAKGGRARGTGKRTNATPRRE